MTTMTRTTLLVGILAAATVVLVLIGAPQDAGRPDTDGVLEVTLEDYSFSPDELTLPTGTPLTLHLVNVDDPSHHVAFGREVVERDGRAVGFAEDLLEGVDLVVTPPSARVDDPLGTTTVLVRGHETVTIELMLPADRTGRWEIGCFTGRGCHYQAGLGGTVVVE